MLSPSARAIYLSLILLVPLAPAAEADLPGAVPPTWIVPMYVQSGSELPGFRGMSALRGDAMPADGSTRDTQVRATSPMLPAELVLVKDRAFRVVLESPTNATYVNGSIVVSLHGADASRIVLARRDLAPPPAVSAGWLDPLVDAGGAHYANLDRYVANATAQEPGQLAARETYARLCSVSDSPQCRAYEARYGMAGSFDLCVTSPPPTLLGQAVWTAWTTADRAQAGATGARLCERPASAAVNASAAQADNVLEPVPPVPWSGLPPYPLDLGNSTPIQPPHSWRNVSLDAAPPAWLPQDATTFRVPSGFRLQLEVQLVGAASTPAGEIAHPLTFEMGRADAPTRLEIQTATPQAFSRLAFGASPIQPGRHTGHFANATDVDDYAFDVPPGARVTVATGTPTELRFTLYDPDGAARTGAPRLIAEGQPGRWTLRVGHDLLPSTSEYWFSLSVSPASGSTHIVEGTYTDALGPGDDEDTWTFSAWQAQAFSLSIEHGQGASYRLEHVRDGGVGIWDVSATATSVSARAASTGTVAFRVVRSWGEGPYALTLDLNEGGDLSGVPNMTTVWADTTTGWWWWPGGARLAAYDGGVDFVFNGTLHHLDETGAATIVPTLLRPTAPLGRTGDGDLLYRAGPDVVLDDGVAAEPVVRLLGSSDFALGPDDEGYAVASWNATGGELRRVRPDRTFDRMSIPSVHQVILAPDGSVYAKNATGTLRVDVDAGTAVEVRLLRDVTSFDIDGRGYRVLNGTIVERVDPRTGEARVVATASLPLSRVTLAGSKVFGMWETGMRAAIVAADVGATAFEGFRPDYDPLPPPDLVPIAFEDVVEGVELASNGSLVGEKHLLRVHVTNRGEGPAYDALVRLERHCGRACGPPPVPHVGPHYPSAAYRAEARVPSLAPGASTVLEFRWNSTRNVGDQVFVAWVSPPLSDLMPLAESNVTNNRAPFRTYAWAGGHDRLCHALLDGKTVPPPPVGPHDPLRTIGLGSLGDACYSALL